MSCCRPDTLALRSQRMLARLSRSLHSSRPLSAKTAAPLRSSTKTSPSGTTNTTSSVRAPVQTEARTFQLYQVNPQRVTDFKFKFFTGCFIIFVAGGNISFAFYDWHQIDENGKKAYANQAWRLGCTTLTMLSAGGVFWAAWRLSSSNVKRINMSLPEAPKTSPKDARKALLNRYSQASVEIETFLPPHPFSARADKIYNYKLSELRLDGPLSQTQKPWHPHGFKYSDPTGRRGKSASHVPISRPKSAGERVTDYVRWLRPYAPDGLLPPPSAFHALTPFAVAKDGTWDQAHLEDVERAMLELQR